MHGSSSFSASTTGSFAGPNGQGADYWGDTITVTSNSLPVGTPVTLQATLTFHRTLTGSGTGLAIQADATGPFGLDISDSFNFPNATETLSTTTLAHVGDSFFVQGSLSFQAAGTAAFNAPVSGSIDISNTAVFNLVSLDPAASYTTASGVSYVPEPASFALAAMGALLLGVSCRLDLKTRPRSAK